MNNKSASKILLSASVASLLCSSAFGEGLLREYVESDMLAASTNIADVSIVSGEVKDCDGKQCLAVTGINKTATSLKTQLKADIAVLGDILAKTNKDATNTAMVDLLTDSKQKLEKLVDDAKDGEVDSSAYVDLVAPNLNTEDKIAVVALHDASSLLDDIIATKIVSGSGVAMAQHIKQQTDDIGSSTTNLNSASSVANNVISTANNISTGDRVAMFKNPYGNFASKFNGLKFAAGGK